MKFRLSYEGELFATQRDALGEQPVPRAPRKHAIRRRFHEQLKRYWDSNWILRNSKAGLSNHKAEDLPFIIDGGGQTRCPSLRPLLGKIKSWATDGSRSCVQRPA